MKQLMIKLFGNPKGRSLEQWLFIGMTIFGIIQSASLAIFTYFKEQYFHTVFILSISLVCGVAYYFACFKQRYLFVFGFLFIVLVNCLIYFYAGGINGPMPFILILLLVLALMAIPRKWHFKFFLIHLSVLFFIFLIEYIFPQLVHNPYKSQNGLHAHLLIGILVCTCLSFAGIYFLRNRYDIEKIKNQKQQALLERANYQRSMFFINLSHEIKTPLTLVENFLEKYIKNRGEDEELIIMRRNVQKMRRDILDYLNLENLERGQVSYEKLETLFLSKFLVEKTDFFAPYAENKGIALCSDIKTGIFVDVNLQGMDQVLNNLLENAVKYTPKAGKIDMSLKKEGSHAKLVIRNSGTEIPGNQISHLFEPFYQLSHKKLNTQGIGMGLYIVKKILDSTNGHINVSSTKEEGVTFTVVLPLSSIRKITVEPTNTTPLLNTPTITLTTKAADSTYLTNRPSLLLVEDNNDLLRYMAEQLMDSYNVYVACNGAVAIEKLEKIPVPDLIVSDIMMDTMDGYELLDRTMNDERFSHIPFIFITAKAEPKEKIMSINKGAFDFITKPFLMDELGMKIKTIIEQKNRISAAAIREIKKQFTNDNLLGTRQKQDDTFNLNALTFGLTDREKEIILHMRDGLDYEKIAETLHISKHTVNRHVQNIYEKTCANSKTTLINKLFLQASL